MERCFVSFICVYILTHVQVPPTDAAIVPVDATYTTTLGNDFSIQWIFDNEAYMETVDWTYQSNSTATATTIMSKVGTAAASVFNNYNVEHVSNGEITLKTVTMDNAGIYFCTVFYTVSSGNPTVTGTATLSVTAYGQDVGFNYNSDCYSAGDTMTLTAEYKGSGTVTLVQWYYSGQVAQNLLVVASTCQAVTPIDSGYPASRMTYECNLGTNTFKLVLTGLLEEELDKTWGATFSLSVGPSPSVNKTEISTCVHKC